MPNDDTALTPPITLPNSAFHLQESVVVVSLVAVTLPSLHHTTSNAARRFRL
jgi:hypothetical protein